MRSPGRSSAALLVFSCLGCGDGSPTPPVIPTPPPVIVPGAASGPTQIVFVSAEPPPGSSLQGCGPDIGGCRGRLRLVLRLQSPSGGPVLRMNVFLHSDRKIACLLAETGAFDLPAGSPLLREVVFDQSDACATPVSLVTMDAVLTGPVQVDSRQEWGVRWDFGP